MVHCQWCGDAIKEKDVYAINQKLLGEETVDFFCMDCLAEYCGCDKEMLIEKIEQFKQEGCSLFS